MYTYKNDLFLLIDKMFNLWCIRNYYYNYNGLFMANEMR